MSEPQKDDVTATGATEAPSESAAKLRLTKAHPLVQRTLDLKVEKDQWGVERRPTWPGVDVRVSKGMKRNALIVLDRLFKALERRDVEISVCHDQYQSSGTFAARGHDKVQVYVTEDYEKVPHVPTAAELRAKEKDPIFSPRIPKNDSIPTGKLTLVPGGAVDLSSEAALAQVVAKAVDDIVQKIESERARREAAEAQRRREWNRQQQEQEEKARADALHKSAAAFRQYRELMDYIDEVRRHGRVPDDQRKEGQTLEEWLRWAEWRARIIHPLG